MLCTIVADYIAVGTWIESTMRFKKHDEPSPVKGIRPGTPAVACYFKNT
jgi:hypothetical protein